MKSKRRDLLLAAAAASAVSAQSSPMEPHLVQGNDRSVDHLLSIQNTNAQSRWYGGFPDGYELHHGGTAMACFDSFACALSHPQSKHYQSSSLFGRLKLAGAFLDRHTSPDGNVNLLITNFNSPPDSAFGARAMAMGARVAQIRQQQELLAFIRPYLERAGRALAKGGLHTPNHRWIHCSSLAQIHEVFPDEAYLKRIDQWLAEGIDVDGDGQFTERSTGTYNMVVNSSLILLADKLKRWELLEPVRRNLDATIHLMHANGELVTDISTRQDQHTIATIAPYWFALQYLALHDKNPLFAGLAAPHTLTHLSLSYYTQWPDLARTNLPTAAAPARYTRHFPGMGVTRLRREQTSATILSQRDSRFFQVRHGDAVVNAVRFATGFFGKGQFRAATFRKEQNSFVLTQDLKGPYYQPLAQPVGMQFEEARRLREQTEVCSLTHRATITEKDGGFDVTIEAEGTDEVPVVIEINLRAGGTVDGVVAAKEKDSHFLTQGHATFRLGEHALKFGPGLHEHKWIVVRGAEPKLAGPSVYLTGYTPFRHTLSFRPV
jgi:hypothetical protein